jgi:Spy/CpxP family protein refolding chaperone
MSGRRFSRIFVAAGAAAGLLVLGIWAGRLAAGTLFERRGRVSVQEMFDHAARRLDLSASQRSEIRGVLRSHEAEILRDIRTHRQARQALRQAIRAEPTDERRIRGAADALGRAEGDAAILRARLHSEIWTILDDDQRDRVAALEQRLESRGDRFAASVESFLGRPD